MHAILKQIAFLDSKKGFQRGKTYSWGRGLSSNIPSNWIVYDEYMNYTVEQMNAIRNLIMNRQSQMITQQLLGE